MTFNIDIVFETLVDLDENFITIESIQAISNDYIIYELDINPIRLHDNSGEAIPTILNPNRIDLTKAVPEQTFGEFFHSA